MQQQVHHLNYINDTDLNDKNFVLYAAKHYENPHCENLEEFYTDLQIPMHLKKLFTRYHVNQDLKERLIINHVISLFNVFDGQTASKILFLKIEEKYYSYLKTVLVYLNRCPKFMIIRGKLMNTDAIPLDEVLLKELESQ